MESLATSFEGLRFTPGDRSSPSSVQLQSTQRRRKRFLSVQAPPSRPWLLVPPPTDLENLCAYSFVFKAGATYSQVMMTLKKVFTECKQAPPLSPFKIGEFVLQPVAVAHDGPFVKKCVHLARKNQRIRFLLSCFLKQWLFRRLIPGNDYDPVTCESPRRPIRFIDWPQRRIYTFEASTILRDMRERLLYQNYLFTEPKSPRNPYTNVEFSLGQYYSVFKQLRVLGLSHWALEGLTECLYNLEQFHNKFASPLRFAALKDCFSDPTNSVGKDLLYEFMEDQHDIHEKPFLSAVYLWALDEAPTSSIVKFWRHLCMKYHELEITVRDPTTCRNYQKLYVIDHTRELCEHPSDLIALRNTHMKKIICRESPRLAIVIQSPPQEDAVYVDEQALDSSLQD